MNSAKELITECTRMLEIASTLDTRLDVYGAVKEVSKEMTQLNAALSREDYSVIEVAKCKESFNRCAIRLEFVLSTLDEELRHRYLNRSRIAKAEVKVRELMRKSQTREDLVLLASDLDLLSPYIESSKWLVFKLSHGDERNITRVETDIEEVSKSICLLS